MKIKSQIGSYFSVLLLSFALFSCQKEESADQPPQAQQLENFIDKAKASEIASEFTFDVKAKNSNETTYLKKEVAEVSSINDEEENTVFYIINYKDGGFVILAADNRSIPVLAYSDSETFDLKAESYPSGLVNWLASTKESIKYVRENNIEQNIETKLS
ncbi:Spi family protease inhibitor [Aequorivita sublithincola]|uniref:Spi family protease inhibitor n=1 Tax=Aequorivita sublithincola TaxID=101385 RepID=UPI000305D247|nr:Spi family protease inhibitor [Aequorivita sublithincola]